MRTPRTRHGLLLLFGAALLLRVAVVFALAPKHGRPIAYEHGEIARNLLAGKGFSIRFLGTEGPTSQQAPFYPLLVAGAYSLFGVDSPAAVLALQLLQCLAGAGVAVCLAWLAWSCFPEQRAAGWWAGVAAAVYPSHLYMVTHVQAVVWATAFLTGLLALSSSDWGLGRRRKPLALGALAALMLLCDPILALAVPVAAAAYWQRELAAGAKKFAAFERVAFMAVVAAACLAPWLVRNYRVHGEFVFVKSTFGYAFWQGNNPASWGTDKIPKPLAEEIRQSHDGSLADIDRQLWQARHETLYIDDVLLKPQGFGRFAGLTEPARSRVLQDEAFSYIRDNPLEYLRLCSQRLKFFLLFDETNPKAANAVYRASTVVWLVLAFVGVLASRGHWRRLWPTWAIFTLITVFHSLTIVSARFRIPLEPMSFAWPAIALSPGLGRVAGAAGDFAKRRWRAQDDSVATVLPGPGTADEAKSHRPSSGDATPSRKAA